MTLSFKAIIPIISLIAVLAMSPVAPEAGNTIFLVAGAIGLALMWPAAQSQFPRPIVWMPLLGVLLLAPPYLVTGGVPGLVGLAFFAPLLAIWPLVTLLRNAEISPTATLVGVLSLCGATGAAIMAISEVQATGTFRAGQTVANPVHFADVALLVGFTALIGLVAERNLRSIVFFIAPVMAIAAVTLSGTRGAMLAIVVMIGVATLAAAIVRVVSRRLVFLSFVGLVALATLAFFLGGEQLSGVQRMMADITGTLSSGMPTDGSTAIRVQMYVGGMRAFLEAPLFGQGLADFTTVAEGLADAPFGSTPHLHNDIVDMAASAGVFGLVAYALMILAPLVEVLRAPRSSRRPWTVVVVFTLVIGYFVMGLTNAMFGILTVTTTFAAICVITGLLTSPAAARAAD